jgi:hypothetical protein
MFALPLAKKRFRGPQRQDIRIESDGATSADGAAAVFYDALTGGLDILRTTKSKI